MTEYKLLNSLKLPDDLKTLSKNQYPHLVEEVRDFITEAVTQNGGHLGPNLGVVEIILACHILFDLSKDRLVFDVGHQVYPHKILSGRHRAFTGLRKKGGLSGYPHQGESPYDVYRGGHASTAISTALGIRCGFDFFKKNRERYVIALVGDGSMTGGMAFEGLNHSGHMKKNLIVILNDNSMSISPTIGGLAKTFSDFRHNQFYYQFREGVVRNLKKIPAVGNRLEAVVNYSLDEAARLVTPQQIFTVLGFDYLGPIDGNNVNEVITALTQAKAIRNKPVLIHALTQKGLGYKPDGRQGGTTIGPHALSGKSSTKSGAPSYSAAAVEILLKLARKDRSVITVTAAMAEGTGLNKFQDEFPDRYYDVGICEAHAVGLSAGLATSNLKPVFAVYSTFLQRGFDQIFHDIILQRNLPVLLLIDRAGLVGDDGPSHHGSYDIAYLRIFPDMILMAPRDRDDLEKMIEGVLNTKNGSKFTAIRYPRSSIPNSDIFDRYQNISSSSKSTKKENKIDFGKSEILKLGKSGVCFYAYGSMVVEAAHAEKNLAEKGIDVSLVNVRYAKPIDMNTFKKLYKTHKLIIVLEEGVEKGGLGSAILEAVNSMPKTYDGAEIAVRGLPDRLVEHASRNEQFQECGLDSKSLITWVGNYVNKSKKVKRKNISSGKFSTKLKKKKSYTK